MDKPVNIGFVGLGVMGYPMATNLISKLPSGSTMRVYDVQETSIRNLVDTCPESVVACRSAKEVTEDSEVILTMVPEGSHVRSVYLDAQIGILAATPVNRIYVDCSTIDTETSLAVLRAVERSHPNAKFLDAPVSGGSLGAENATLTFMVGCSEKDEKWLFLEALLSLMGKSIIACGAPSLGLVSKLSNNYCSALISLATAEALNMGMKLGMDPRQLAKIFSTSTAQSTICDKWNPVPGLCPDAPSSHDYRGGFKVQLMRKDFQLAIKAGQSVGAKLLLAEAGLDAYTKASEDVQCRDRDSRVLFRYLGGNESWEEQ